MRIVIPIVGFITLTILSFGAFMAGAMMTFGREERVSGEFWDLLLEDRATAIASIVDIQIRYWPSTTQVASEATLITPTPDPEVFHMDDPSQIARIFPETWSRDFFDGTIGSIHLDIRTKQGETATIVIYNDSDMHGEPLIGPAFGDPATRRRIPSEIAHAMLDWITERRTMSTP